MHRDEIWAIFYHFVPSDHHRRIIAAAKSPCGWIGIFVFASVVVLSLLFSSPARAQVDGFDLWQEITEQQAAARLPAALKTAAKRDIVPQAYRTLALNKTSMAQLLAAAPAESPTRSTDAGSEILLPLPQGGYGRFSVLESPLMEPALAAQFPEIKNYILQGIDDPTATGRLDTSPKGFRAMVIGAEGTFFIDPYWSNNDDASICYAKKDFTNADKLREWSCGVVGGGSLIAKASRSEKNAARPTGTTLRVYRAAIAATAEYTAFHGNTVAGALAAINTTLARVNTVYERDFCIRMILVGNNNLLVYTNALTDPYTNGNADLMIDENQTNIDNVIGNANYDIGHVFGTNSGGLASLGSVCETGFKAQGVTGSDAPVGDPFDIDYVCHEMGHQFNAEHTFNALSDPQRNATTAFEPGSGSTIMSYAGIVDGENLQEFANDYFHTGSYTEIDDYTSSGVGAGAISNIATGNSPPVIGALSNYTVPARTPFVLSASATDANADTLTYCWEEYDVGPAQNPTASPRDNGSSPIFRSYRPTTNATRFFPSLQYILNNTNNPPATYTSNSISTWVTGETIPTTSRTMTYRVSVRDNRAGGGAQNWASAQVTTISNAGPFRISSQNTASTLSVGTPFNVTWDVAGTTAAPISAANVKISLSTNGGTNFPVVLAASVPNNGTASVTIPAGNTTTAGRLKVEAVGNIFFDINDVNLTIPSAAQTTIFTENVGVPTGTTTIANYVLGTAPATFENKGVLTYGQGDQALPADVRATQPSSGYAGASGGGNVFFTSTANTYGFSIEGINASALTSLTLTYGYRKELGTALPTFSVDYWNGAAWVTVANTADQLFNEAATAPVGWYLAKSLSLPAGAQIANLKIRFVKSGTTSVRIDDIKLTGEVPAGSPIISSFTPTFGLAGTTVTISGSDLNGATSVSFGGVNATTFTVVGPTSITAQVPVGAATGKISVTTPQGTATSLADFFVSATPPPALTATPTSISGLTTTAGTASASTNYTIVASNLTGNLLIGPTTAAYELSTNGTTWASTLTLPQTGGSLSNTIFVRLSAAAATGSANAAVSNSIVGSGTSLTNLPTLSGLVEAAGTPGLIYWNFNTATPTSGVPSGWAVEAISRGNNMAVNPLLESASVSSGYVNPFGVAASGTFNATAGAVGGALNAATNAYYEIKIVPSSSSAITNISFGARSTSSGPQAYTIRSSADNFATDLATGTLLTNSAWAMKVNAPVTVALSNGTNTLRIYGYNGTNVTGTAANWRIDDLTLAVQLDPNAPAINVTPSSISTLSAILGSSGTGLPFQISGSNLTGNLTVTAPANFEVSTTSATTGFGATATVTASGTLAATEVWVRIASGAPAGSIGPANVIVTGGGATQRVVAVSGAVTNPNAPNLSVSPASLSGFNTTVGSASGAQTFSVTGANLTSSVVITPPTGFAVSSDGATFSTTALTIPLAQFVSPATISVRLTGAAQGSPSGNVTVASTGATTQNVTVSGTVTAAPVGPVLSVSPTNLPAFVTVAGTFSTNQTFTVSATNLTGPLNVAAPANFEVSLDGSSFGPAVIVSGTGAPVVVASDNATNAAYTGGWTNGANGGSGFGAWSIISSNGTAGFGGVFIGNPTNAGITPSVSFGTNAFGMYANPGTSGAFANADRSFTALQSGQTFSFQWAINWDSDVGNKGFSLFAGGTSGSQVLNVNQGGFPGDISFSAGGTTNTNIGLAFGTGPMTWSFTMTSSTNMLVTSSPRDGTTSPAFSTNIAVAAAPDAFRWYVSAMSAGDTRQPYYNDLRITSAGGGSVAPTTIYVRVKSDAVAGAVSGNVTVGGGGTTPQNVSVSGRAAQVSVSPLTLNQFVSPATGTPPVGLASPAQTLTVSGAGLGTDPLNLAPLAGYQFSTNGTTYVSSLTLTPVGGTVTATTVNVRLAAGGTVGATPSGDLTFTSGAASQTVPVTGVVIPPDPFVQTSPASITGFSTTQGTASTAQSFGVQGFNLTTGITVTAPSGFEVSLSSGSGFGSSVNIAQSGGSPTPNPTTVYVRIAATAPGSTVTTATPVSGSVALSSGTASGSLAVSGTVLPTPAITVQTSNLVPFNTVQGVASMPQLFTVTASNALAGIVLTAPAGFELSLNDATYSSSVTVPQAAAAAPNLVYVRLAASAPAGNPAGSISATTQGALVPGSVAVSGTVRSAPALSINGSALVPFTAEQGRASAAQLFTVSAANLVSDVTVSAPAGYEISLDGTTFAPTAVLEPDGGQLVRAAVVVGGDNAGNYGNQTTYDAFNDFYVNVPATGGAGDYNRSTWIANAGTVPFDTGLTTPNTWGYAGGNFNGVGAPSSVGTYLSGGNFYPLTSGGIYAGPGASYALPNTNFWIGYNDQYGTVGLPNAQTQIGKYTREWFSGSPNWLSNSNGTNNKFLWLQGTGLSASTDGLGAMLTWTAPKSGTFQFSGSYVNGNYGNPTSFAIVDSLSNTLLAKQTLAPSSATNAFGFTRTYSAGDVVQFQVGTPAAAQGSPLGLAVTISSGQEAWQTGANGGTGFGPWTISATQGSGSGGAFIGNPASAGIAAIPTNSFGLFANPTNSSSSVVASRSLTNPLQVGQTLSFQWGMNFDSGTGGSKGFTLYSGGTNGTALVTVTNGGSEAITVNAVNSGFGYGTNAMTWTFYYTNTSTLVVTANDRDGSGFYTTNIPVTGAPDAFAFRASQMQAGDQAQPYFNNFRLASGLVGGQLSAVPIYIRLKSDAQIGPAGGDVTASATLAVPKTLLVSGTVIAAAAQPAQNNNFVDKVYRFLLYRGADPAEIAKYCSADFLASSNGFASNAQKSKVIMDIMGFANNVTANATNSWASSFSYTNEYAKSAGTIFSLFQRFPLTPQPTNNTTTVRNFVFAIRTGQTNTLVPAPSIAGIPVGTATVGLAQAVKGLLDSDFFTNSANAPVRTYALNGPVISMSDYLQNNLFKANNSPAHNVLELRNANYALMQSSGMAALAPNTNTYATATGIALYSAFSQSGLIPNLEFSGSSAVTTSWRNWMLALNRTGLEYQLWEKPWNFSATNLLSTSSVGNLLRVPVIATTNLVLSNGIAFTNNILVADGASPINARTNLYFTASDLPVWAYLSSDGRIEGRPTTPGNYTSIVTAQNIAGWSQARQVVFQVSSSQVASQAQTWMAANYSNTGTLYAFRTNDTDGDGFNTAAEYAFGSNPNVPNARIMNFSNVSANVMRITWNGLTNQTYTLQVSTNLVGSPAWTNRPNALISANGPLINTNGAVYQPLRTDVTNSGASNVFYRIWTEFSQQALE